MAKLPTGSDTRAQGRSADAMLDGARYLASLRDAREVFEREYLLAQVTRFGGNISRTATFVGMERSALHRKLKSLGLHGGAADERSPSETASAD